ncbi:MAG TPA: T9SS type A sorting domain-containing protein, partial [Ignavibacteria bacterium]
GCDSALNLGYTYNSSNFDWIYGTAPPAVAFQVLRGALKFTGNNNDTVYICRNKTRVPLVGYKDLRMSVFNWYYSTNDPCWGNPANFRESYRFMAGLSRCGTPRIHPSGYITNYIFSGDPVTNQGWIQPGSDDQRFLMSTGPVNVAPNDTQVVVVAQLIARGTSNLNSITKLRELSAVVKNYYNTCYTTPAIGIEPISNEVPRDFKLYQNYPNPFNPTTTIRFEIPSLKGARGMNASLIIYDALGKEVATLVNEKLTSGAYEVDWNASNFASGVYFYKLTSDIYSETKKMVLTK